MGAYSHGAEVMKMKRTVLCLVLTLSSFGLSESAQAQEKPTAERPGGGSKSATLSAEERIRRATVPPPGKECPQDPQDTARAALDAQHSRNLAFVTVSDVMIERALKISESEWRKRWTKLQRDTRQDWLSWFTVNEREGLAWTSLPPCPEPGETAAAPSSGERREPRRRLTNLVGLALGLRRASPELPTRCRPGDKACEAKEAQGLADSKRDGPVAEGTPECHVREVSGLELYASVRGALMAGRTGASLLVASASNVPVACSVDVSIERKGAVVERQSVQFLGPGSRGGIVREVALGFEPDVYRDTLVLNATCVPHFRWGRSRSYEASGSPEAPL
jgi:hypothetical protein